MGKSTQNSKTRLQALLNEPEIRAAILQDAARFEDLILLIVSIYLTPGARGPLFVTLFSHVLSFNQRVELLKNLPFRRRPKSMECIHTIKLIQRLRNYVAHPRMIIRKPVNILDEPRIQELFINYPESYRTAIRKANKQLYLIGNMKETLRYHLGGNDA